MVRSGKPRLRLGDTLHMASVQFPWPEVTVGFDHNQDGAFSYEALPWQLF